MGGSLWRDEKGKDGSSQTFHGEKYFVDTLYIAQGFNYQYKVSKLFIVRIVIFQGTCQKIR